MKKVACIIALLLIGCSTTPEQSIIADKAIINVQKAEQENYVLEISQQGPLSPTFVSIRKKTAESGDSTLMAEYNSDHHFLLIISELFEDKDEHLRQVAFGDIAAINEQNALLNCRTWTVSPECFRDIKNKFLIWPKDFNNSP